MNGTTREAPPLDRGRPWSLAAAAGSIATAFLASACCIGPLVLALLGLGGGALLVKLEAYRSYFTAATVALLGGGFYLTYRKPKAAAADCACPAPRANRAGKIMLWIATVLVAAFLGFPYLAPYLFG